MILYTNVVISVDINISSFENTGQKKMHGFAPPPPRAPCAVLFKLCPDSALFSTYVVSFQAASHSPMLRSVRAGRYAEGLASL
jgi:hypothetical protein